MLELLARYFADGGPLMWAILAIVGCATAVIVERSAFYLIRCRDRSGPLVADAVKALNHALPERALRIVSRRQGPLNAVLAVAIERYRDGHSHAEIRQAVEEVALREVPRFSQRLGYLSTFANVATLAGLLGTIFGLQVAFRSLVVTNAAEKAAVLASGIAQAMNTTSFGLIVAIPCLLAHAVLVNLQTRRAEDLDAGAIRLLNYLENRPEQPDVIAGRISA
jgi:biopolymer transport protein ExbB